MSSTSSLTSRLSFQLQETATRRGLADPISSPCSTFLRVGILLPHALPLSGFLLSVLCQSDFEQVFHPRLQRDFSSALEEPKGEYLRAFCLYSRSNSSLRATPNLGCLWSSSHASSFLSWSSCFRAGSLVVSFFPKTLKLHPCERRNPVFRQAWLRLLGASAVRG